MSVRTSVCRESLRSPGRARRSSCQNLIGCSSPYVPLGAIRLGFGCFALSHDVRKHAHKVGQRSSLQYRSLLAVFAAGLLLSWTSESFAYRPFDGTDEAVADVGEAEVELQPAGAQWSRGQNLLIAPAVVYNYGLLKDWVAVLESQLQTPFSPSGPTKLSASAVSLKHVIRPGSLQDQ